MLRNNRGVTLMELVMAMTMAGLLLTVAIMLYQSIFHVSESGMQRYLDHSGIGRTMSKLEQELVDAIHVVKVEETHELRYVNGLFGRALVFDPAEKTLALYDLNADGDLSTATLKEENFLIIADNVADFSAEVQDSNHVLNLSIEFEISKVNASGFRQPATETRELSIKWMDVST